MEQAAKEFEQENETLRQMLTDLMGKLAALETAWVGQGGRTFSQVKEQWSAEQAKIHQALAETAGAIRSAGQHYTAADSEAASRINRSAGGGLTLPL